MSKYIGKQVFIKKKFSGTGIDMKDKSGVIEEWDNFLGKYKISFDNSWVGWYTRSELIFEK